MRFIYSLTVLAVLASCSYIKPARSTTTGGSAKMLAETRATKDKAFCGDYAHMSAMIMENRQIGVPISRALGFFNSGSGFDKLMHVVVVEAYKTPAFSAPRDRTEAIIEFANRQHALCLQA
ncbi:hypothetical protein [Paracoccus benzoatiresistens]|uniref:Lipoprotein n=1 Tax=Paracoccus benzoatiresistens TaxID=2997341 RepID=A0ABT4JAV1_9RHOB|nr:hypothetical protein [Paracoccus sp. EF6]MCZ0964260.1 hypothetical protein [Paracoccus sp. EF6]